MKAHELAQKCEDAYEVDERPMDKEIAAELRRLAEVNAELLSALETSVSIMKIQRDVVERGQHSGAWYRPICLAESAIAKAKEQQ